MEQPKSESAAEHQRMAASTGPVRLAVVTVSDTRTAETDKNGKWLRGRIEEAGHVLVAYHIVPDDPERITDVLGQLIQSDAQVLLFNGGTGIAPRDNTFDALAAHLEKEMPGFGELFRMLSYEQVGAAAMLSRAVAGVYHGRVLFSTPGSHAAVQLAWDKLIFPELRHLAWEAQRSS